MTNFIYNFNYNRIKSKFLNNRMLMTYYQIFTNYNANIFILFKNN